MPQQMHFDEEQQSYSSGYTPHASYEDGPDVRPPVNDPQGYKLGQPGQYQFTPRSPIASAGQRLALAIVSIAIMIPIISILLGDNSSSIDYALLIVRLVGLGIVCLAIAIINVVFNRGR